MSTSTLASAGNSQHASSNKMHYKLSAFHEHRGDNKALLVAVSGQKRVQLSMRH